MTPSLADLSVLGVRPTSRTHRTLCDLGVRRALAVLSLAGLGMSSVGAAAIALPPSEPQAAMAQSEPEQPGEPPVGPTDPSETGPEPTADAPGAADASAERADPPPLGEPIEVAATAPLSLLVPDVDFVYGPPLFGFDAEDFVSGQGGFLSRHLEVVDGKPLVGGQIVQRVADDFSLSPRMLLALIELESGWVRGPAPASTSDPLNIGIAGLHPSLEAAAVDLQSLYYGHRHGGARSFAIGGDRSVTLPQGNAASWAMSAWLTRTLEPDLWPGLERQSRFWAVWTSLFGAEPYETLTTPTFDEPMPEVEWRMPFADGTIWYLIEGPSSPRAEGGARAALTFAPPPASATGCFPGAVPVLAMASGVIARSEDRGLVIDLDGDGYEGGLWSLVYRHLAPEGRAAQGTRVTAGQPLGLPSCTDGARSAADGQSAPEQTRVSVARKYNGEWVAADDPRAPWRIGQWEVVAGPEPGLGALVRTGYPPREADVVKRDRQNGVPAIPGG